ncbi:transposase [Nitrosomonas sp. Nm33]|uniref:transposase n=1 Tax=Nitrosomonas sp. Nm33 TaxID=133724 RepID=UPI0008967206|nr:transposase [Nitrosomonas sp. Nm33]SDZ14049.1 Putative transposase [Nitrosomonas sp. Nm33]
MTPATRRLPLRLCPIADERLARNQDGQVVLTLKTPYRDGTTHIVMSPLEFMQRLAVLVPRPRLNLIRFHGVLAPNAKPHPEIIPDSKKNKNHVSDRNDDAPPSPASVRISWALCSSGCLISTSNTVRIVVEP